MTLAAAQAINAVAALVTAAGVGGVFTSRTWPLAEAALPAWRVTAADEDVETLGAHFPAQQQHDLTVAAQGYVRNTATLDQAMHTIAEAVLVKLFASASAVRLSPLNCVVTLTGIRRDFVTENEAALGRITLLLRVRFLTFDNAPGTIV